VADESAAKKAAAVEMQAEATKKVEAEAAAKEKAKQAAETAATKALEEAAATPSASDGAEKLKVNSRPTNRDAPAAADCNEYAHSPQCHTPPSSFHNSRQSRVCCALG
jgi:hypothetical protein